jgi:hypothetical protein
MKPALLLALPLLTLALSAHAQSEWRLTGSNTLRFEHYEARGNVAASPYAHLGTQRFNELNLGLVGRTGPQSLWRLQFAGVVNDSDYRSREQGLVPERVSIFHERGDGALPFRLELGDQMVGLSPLTLQRTLKGARVELMPLSAVDGRQHSLTVFAGADNTTWRDFDTDSEYRGASWRVADNRLGRLRANVVYHSKDGETAEAGQSEWVSSLMAERSFDFAHQRLLAQGEWAHFKSENGAGEAADEHTDTAVNARLSGQDGERGLSYEVSYERHGEHFRPSGVDLVADFRALSARAGVGLGSGVQVSGRAQRTTHGVQSTDPIETANGGVTITAPVPTPFTHEPATGKADVTVQARESESGAVDNRSATARLDLGLPLLSAGETRVGMMLAGFDNRNTAGTDRITRQLSLSQGVRSTAGDMELEARAGLVYQEVDGTRPQQTLDPTLSLVLTGQAHRFGMTLGLRRFATALEGGVDVDTYAWGVNYQFRQQRHTLGLEFDQQLRQPDGAQNTESWRFGAFWRYNFDHAFGA